MATNSQSFSTFIKVLFISFFGIPVCYLGNSLFTIVVRNEVPSIAILIISFAILALILAVGYYVFQGTRDIKDPFFYGFVLFAFTSVIDILVALEIDGFIEGFIGDYLDAGEPYLRTPYGAMVTYWDAVGLYPMYLIMSYHIGGNMDYRTVAIYWAANLGHSMIVYTLGIFFGKYGIYPTTAINIPYIVLPLIVGLKFASQSPKVKLQKNYKPQPLNRRIWDCLFIVFLVFATVITTIRAMTVMNSPNWLTKAYGELIEPHIKEESEPYLKTQMFVYLFYYMPLFISGIYALIKPGCSWMLTVSIILAGALSQGQICHIGTTIHFNTPDHLRVPQNLLAQSIFWTVNLSFLIVPQLLFYRCVKYPDFLFSSGKSSIRNNERELKNGNKVK